MGEETVVLRFAVTNQDIERLDEYVVVEGSENYLKAQFTFMTDDWKGLFKTGIFICATGEVHTSLCTDDACDVPREWIREQKGAVGLIGSDGTTKITTRTASVRIRGKGYDGDGGLEEEAETYFSQIMAALSAAMEKISEETDGANKAEKSAEAWAHGHGEYPDRDADNAMYYARAAMDAAAQVPGRAEDAKRVIDAYVAEKEAELKGDTGNVYFAAFKVVDGRLIMYSDPDVDKVHFYRDGSRLKYRLVMQGGTR